MTQILLCECQSKRTFSKHLSLCMRACDQTGVCVRAHVWCMHANGYHGWVTEAREMVCRSQGPRDTCVCSTSRYTSSASSSRFVILRFHPILLLQFATEICACAHMFECVDVCANTWSCACALGCAGVCEFACVFMCVRAYARARACEYTGATSIQAHEYTGAQARACMCVHACEGTCVRARALVRLRMREHRGLTEFIDHELDDFLNNAPRMHV